jgi:hypothetical protein
MQNDADGQDTLTPPFPNWASHAPAPPAGSVDVTVTAGPTATQSVAVGHETLDTTSFAAKFTGALHELAPASGLVDTTMSPALSTATHSVVDGHETLVRGSEAP